MKQIGGTTGRTFRYIFLIFSLVFSSVPLVRAQEADLDQYKWRGTAFWWFSQPGGFFKGTTADSTPIDLNRDFGFGSYSTFSGNLDWRFKRKHHFLFGVSPLESSRSVTLSRTINFQGNTYNVGTTASAEVNSFAFAPGYQWDFIRRHWGFVGLPVQFYMLDTSASVTGEVTVNDQTVSRKSSASFFAPLPVIGLRSRWYPMHDSDRLALDGTFQGMYFFGYGDFYAARATAGVRVARNWRLTGGYLMGTRLSIHGTSNQIGIRLTQKGPVAGLEASW